MRIKLEQVEIIGDTDEETITLKVKENYRNGVAEMPISQVPMIVDLMKRAVTELEKEIAELKGLKNDERTDTD